MAEELRPLSDLIAQGWEVHGFSSAHTGTNFAHTVLLRRQRQHKVLVIWRSPFMGVKFSEQDV